MGSRTTPRAQRPAALDHLPPKQPRRTQVAVCFSEDAAEALEAAEREFVVCRDEDKAGAQAALDQARAEVEAATVTFGFEAIGNRSYREMVLAHPPTDEQIAEHDKALKAEAAKELGERSFIPPPMFDIETFGPALISASCTTVDMTPEQWDDELSSDRWNVTEIQALFDAALAANTQMRRASTGKGFASTGS